MKPEIAKKERHFHIADSIQIHYATERIKHILDVKYKPADLQKIVTDSINLSANEQQALRIIWNKHKILFDGSLGTWNN
jgi:hypothetical protein